MEVWNPEKERERERDIFYPKIIERKRLKFGVYWKWEMTGSTPASAQVVRTVGTS
jgi:hypothetical protein